MFTLKGSDTLGYYKFQEEVSHLKKRKRKEVFYSHIVILLELTICLICILQSVLVILLKALLQSGNTTRLPHFLIPLLYLKAPGTVAQDNIYHFDHTSIFHNPCNHYMQIHNYVVIS